MSDDPTTTDELEPVVRRIITEVLMVSPEDVQPETALIDELGAESIDFLDLVFQIEEALGERIPIERWQSYLQTHLQDRDPVTAITTSMILQFARSEANRD